MQEATINPYKVMRIVLLVSITILLTVIIYSISVSVKFSTDKLDAKLVGNYQLADYKFRGAKLNYYTGNNFMSLSLGDLTKKELTHYNLLNDIASIHWLDNGAVVNFSTKPQGPKLTEIVAAGVEKFKKDGVDLPANSIQGMYWYLNFNDSSFTPVTYTENPLDVRTDRSSNSVFFKEAKVDKNYEYFGRVSSSGDIEHNIYVSAVADPISIIGQKDDTLYLTKLNAYNAINLIAFDRKTYKDTTVVDSIFGDADNYSIYENMYIQGDELYYQLASPSGIVLQKLSLTDGKKQNIYQAPSTSAVNYLSDGVFQVTDKGVDKMRLSHIDYRGRGLNKPLILPTTLNTPTMMVNSDQVLVLNRPHISIKSKNKQVTSINEQPIEKDFKGLDSTIERDIYNESGDINTFFLGMPRGSLADEFRRLGTYLHSKDMSISDITVVPRLGKNADYDLD